jgi:processive 1,2-diacylglycerol beta-glucosyltransferase
MKKIMIIYTKYGTGHLKAAKAIEKEFRDTYSDVIIECFDPLSYARPIINSLFAFINKLLSNKFRKKRMLAYEKYMYKEHSGYKNFIYFCTKLFWSKKLKEKINKFNPDLVISTQVGPTGLIAAHNVWKHINVKLAADFTDYAIHEMYIMPHEHVDLYFVPTKSIKSDMIKRGVKKDKICISGIPVSNTFNPSLYNKDMLLKRYNLSSDKLKLLFVCGGGYGLENALNYFESIINLNAKFEYIFIAGNNKRLYKKAVLLASKSNTKGIVMGYVNNMPELMDICDLVVGKPGGLITSESLTMDKPFCAIEPIPGQEVKNAKYIEENDYGYYIKNIKDFNNLIITLLNNKNELKEKENKISKSFIKNSTYNIVKACLTFFK